MIPDDRDWVEVIGEDDLDRHVLDIPGREELAPITTQVRSYQFLVGLALHINVRIQKAVPLEFTHHVGE